MTTTPPAYHGLLRNQARSPWPRIRPRMSPTLVASRRLDIRYAADHSSRVLAHHEGCVRMSPDNPAAEEAPKASRNKWVAIAIGVALGVTLICFTVLAVLPPPKQSLLKDPLRCILTGVAVVGAACPLCIAGFMLKRRFASSPYYEGGFIAGVLNLFGFVILGVGLVCIGFGLYDLAVRFLDSR